MLRSLLLCSLFLALICAAPSQRTSTKLLVMNATPDIKFTSKRSLFGAKKLPGFIGHLMGVYGHDLPEDLPSTNFFRQPKANLMVVIDGAPAASDLSDFALFETEVETSDSSSKALSNALSGSVAPNTEAISIGDLLCQFNKDSSVLSISANAAFLDAVNVLPQKNAFKAFFDAKKSELIVSGTADSNLQTALKALFSSDDLDQFNPVKNGKALFDETVQEDKLFLFEMKALSHLLPSLQKGELASLVQDSHTDLIAFMSVSLKGLAQRYGEGSVEFTSAWDLFKGLLVRIQEDLPTALNNQGVFEVMLLRSQTVSTRERRSVQKRDYTSFAAPCFNSSSVCSNSTNSCSSHGECVLIKSHNGTNAECYRCKCQSSYAGDSCEFINIAAPFHIIFWTSLVLILALIIIAGSLAFMDPGTDTLLFRTVAPKAKKE